ncbi:hypothetical protein DRH14_05010 [Candidatus Shapirobacteria bacterium]|nr:MAG: hypothetical protein DRH14_05010 [Candidatus Shapirobacteria bacterium]
MPKNNIKPLLSIIILSYNTKDITINCLNSILKDKGLCFNFKSATNDKKSPTEIIVVDNNSQDQSVEALKKFKQKHSQLQFKLIINKKNVGFARGNNQAIKIARGNYLLFLNSDTLILHSAISQSLDWLSAHPHSSVCTAQLLNQDKSIQASGGFFPNLFNTFTWALGLDDLPLINKIIPPIHPHTPNFYTKDKFYTNDHPQDWVTGAFMLIRQPVVSATQGFDPSYFMYGEEIEWSYRIKKKFPQQSINYLIGPQIIHLGGASDNYSQNKLIREFQGMIAFFSKHKPVYQQKLVKLFITTGILLRSLIKKDYRHLISKI